MDLAQGFFFPIQAQNLMMDVGIDCRDFTNIRTKYTVNSAIDSQCVQQAYPHLSSLLIPAGFAPCGPYEPFQPITQSFLAF